MNTENCFILKRHIAPYFYFYCGDELGDDLYILLLN